MEPIALLAALREQGPPAGKIWRDALRVSARVQVIPVIVSEPFLVYGTDSFARSLAGARPSSGKDLEGRAPRVRVVASATGNSERAILVYGTDSLARCLAGARPSSGKDSESMRGHSGA